MNGTQTPPPGTLCSKMIWKGWSEYHCQRTPKVLVDGKWWCGTHDPVKVAAKRAAREAEREAARAHSLAVQARCIAAADTLTDRLGVPVRARYNQAAGCWDGVFIDLPDAEKLTGGGDQ